MLPIHRKITVAMLLPVIGVVIVGFLKMDWLIWFLLIVEALICLVAIITGISVIYTLIRSSFSKKASVYISQSWLGIVNGLIGLAFYWEALRSLAVLAKL